MLQGSREKKTDERTPSSRLMTQKSVAVKQTPFTHCLRHQINRPET